MERYFLSINSSSKRGLYYNKNPISTIYALIVGMSIELSDLKSFVNQI